jgi:glutaminase
MLLFESSSHPCFLVSSFRLSSSSQTHIFMYESISHVVTAPHIMHCPSLSIQCSLLITHCLSLTTLTLSTSVVVLRQNQGHNQTVQGKRLTENEHNQHAYIQLVGCLRTAVWVGRVWCRICCFQCSHVELATIGGLHTKRGDADLTENANGAACCKT